ncbi:MAG: low specificity L-threonine aldolase [Alistipes sp.]|jgi:threonine aldolase|nr:low specificity L-threonine aldolase [Alistipes sp.]
MRSFASDNNAGVHPRVMQAVVDANRDHAVGYGDDEWTVRATEVIKKAFGPEAEPFLVFNGTGANSVALQAVTRPWNSIVCTSTAHIAVDECGAPAKMTGCQLVTVDAPDGKLTPEMIEPLLHVAGDQHHSQPGAVYISQTTELGTVYTLDEVRRLADFAHSHGLALHMDGARIANACAATGCTLRQMTVEAGVDVLSLGGTKNGMMMGEAVVAFRPEIARDMRFVRKQSTQLASKMRYLAAQWPPYLSVSGGESGDGGDSVDGNAPATPLWLANARHANDMAARLAQALERFGSMAGNDAEGRPRVRFTQKVESNQIFCILPPEPLARLREKYFFYMWNAAAGEARFVTSWDTTPQDIAEFERTLTDHI